MRCCSVKHGSHMHREQIGAIGRSRYAPEQPGPTFPVQKLRTIFAHMLRKKKEKKKKKKKKKMEVKKMCK
ncbi:hypothetical protein BHM03_00042587 [Ensete ventricosum]|nr:hypothetical protein BHM03_00042587 [Ensete ventricosum]